MKIFVIILAVLLILAGCGQQPVETPTTVPTTVAQLKEFDVQINGAPVIAGMVSARLSEPLEEEPVYQWYLDGEPLPGACADTVTLPVSAAGKALTVTAQAGGWTAESEPVTVEQTELEEYSMAAIFYDSKIYGRCTADAVFLTMDFSASGFEMTVEADGGDMVMSYIAGCDLYVAVFVDGKQVDRPLLNSGAGELKIKLSKGTHTVMVLKETEVSTSGQALNLLSMTFDGKILDKPADRDLYIEFIGDSIACGDGSLGVYTAGEKWLLQDHSGTHGFAYLTAKNLDADWSVFARGGIGLMKPAGDYTAGQIFSFMNRYRDSVTAYKPTRIPDVVVVELGANDDKDDTAGFVAAYNDLVDQIRGLYGEDVKIVWTGKNTNQFKAAQYVAQQREDANMYAFQFAYGGSGSAALTTQSSGHPSAEEQQLFANALTSYLEKNVLN